MVRRVGVESPRAQTELRPQAGMTDSFVRASRATPIADALAQVVPELRGIAQDYQQREKAVRDAEVLGKAEAADLKTYNQFMSDNNNVDAMTEFKIKKTFGRKLGFQYGSFLNDEYANANLIDADPETPEGQQRITEFLSSSKQKFLEKSGIDAGLLQDGGFIGGFAEETDKFTYNVLQSHMAKAREEKLNQVAEALNLEAYQLISTNNDTPEGRRDIGELMTTLIDKYTAMPLGGRKTKEEMVKLLYTAARSTLRDDFLEIAQYIDVGPATNGKRVKLAEDPVFAAEAYKIREGIVDQKSQNTWRAEQALQQAKRKQADEYENALWEARDDPMAFGLVRGNVAQFPDLDQLTRDKIYMSINNASEQFDVDVMTGTEADRRALVQKLKGMSQEQLTNYKTDLYHAGYSRQAVAVVGAMWNDVNDEAQTIRFQGLATQATDILNDKLYQLKQLNPEAAVEIKRYLNRELFNLRHGIGSLRAYADIVGDKNINAKLTALSPDIQYRVVERAVDIAAGRKGVTNENPLGNTVKERENAKEFTTPNGNKVEKR